MYEQFYGFADKPFHLNPDPRFFFESQGHARALAYLHYGIEQGEGFVVVTGDVGTGKTTLARMLYEELQRSCDILTVQLPVPQCTANELLHIVIDAFGLKHERRSKAALLRELFEFLSKQHESGKRALLLIDEVQNLPADALETLRTLSNLHSEGEPLVQIILLGQAEFRHTLNASNLQQLRQRVIASCHLLPFSEPAETQAYIEHRLRHVGWSCDPIVTDEAFRAVHEFTGGIPRRINSFCDRLLLFTYLEEQHNITAETVAAVVEEILSDFPGVVAGKDGADSAGRRALPPEGEYIDRLEQRVAILEGALQSMRDSIARAFPRSASVRGEAGKRGGQSRGAASEGDKHG